MFTAFLVAGSKMAQQIPYLETIYENGEFLKNHVFVYNSYCRVERISSSLVWSQFFDDNFPLLYKVKVISLGIHEIPKLAHLAPISTLDGSESGFSASGWLNLQSGLEQLLPYRQGLRSWTFCVSEMGFGASETVSVLLGAISSCKCSIWLVQNATS